MLSGENIVCLSSIDWDFLWQGHQEIMSRLAASGNLVLFVENTGVRAPTLRDLPRLRKRVRNWRKGAHGFRAERENLFVYSPLVLPFPYSSLARVVNRTLILRAIERWARVVAMSRPIVWTFLPTPLALDVIRGLDPAVTVYYCIDNFAESSVAARRIAPSERAMLRRADLVFVTSQGLEARAREHSSAVSVFPFGVDFETFDKVRRSPESPPADLDGLPRPIVGYVGGLHKWLDQALLRRAAERLPDWSFVLVGPEQTDTSTLGGLANVHRLGRRSHGDVARYINAFDVAVIPYLLTEYTQNVYPTKLNEYLAMGRPVVATALDEVTRFNARHGAPVAVARDAEDFTARLVEAVRDDTEARRAERVRVAEQNGWRARIEAMSALIERQALRNREARASRWRETLTSVYHRVRRQAAVTAAAVVGLYALVFYTPVVWLAAEPLRIAAAPEAADVIVVMAGGVGESGRAGGGYQERVKHAVDLYRQGRAPRMIFSSGYVFAFPETDVMRGLALSLGVPPSALLTETRARNTYEHAAYLRELLLARGWRRALVVSSPYHMRRALLTWRKVAPEITAIPAPVVTSQFYAHGSGATLEQIGGIAHEYTAILAYKWRGWI